ncbi:MAG: histone deacetylase family protein [Gemmatimonadota bacterium]
MASSLTALVLNEHCSLHDTGWQHPEHQGRLPAIVNALYKDTPDLQDLILQREGESVAEGEVLLVHSDAHLQRLKQAAETAQTRQAVVPIDSETLMSPASWEAMLAAAGCVITACDAVLQGDARNGFALARPPGHHATRSVAMGFCLINNVAIAARALQKRIAGLASDNAGAHRPEGVGRAQQRARVLIVDWDVHHGNGTQDIFYDDASVYYFSLHQSPWYPGTGQREERGGAHAPNTTRNVPLPAGTDGAQFLDVFARELDATLSEFEPDFVLVSAGFDCLRDDPLGGLLLEPADLHALTSHLMRSVRHGRIVHTLEGGYNPPRVGAGVVDVVRALAGLPPKS